MPDPGDRGVMLVVGAASGGGTETQWLLLARELLGRGLPVHLATLDATSTPDLDALRRKGLGWTVLTGASFAAGRRYRRATQLAGAGAALWRLVREVQPDVVYSALTITNSLAWAAVRGGWGSRLVWGIRGIVEPYPHFRRAISAAQGAMSVRVPLIISNSQRAIDVHREAGFRPKSWARIPNAIDAERFAPDARARAEARAAWGLTADQPVIASVARITPEKDHPTLLRAFAQVVARHPSAVLLLAGSGLAASRAALGDQARDLGIAGQVRWLGAVRDVRPVYQACDVHVLTSVAEAFPNAIGEAMASGRACVGTNVGDIAALLGRAGETAPAGDFGAIGAAIVGLIEAPERRQALGEEARARVLAEFGPDQLADRTLAAFRENLRSR